VRGAVGQAEVVLGVEDANHGWESKKGRLASPLLIY
jgi:hypothetical protein